MSRKISIIGATGNMGSQIATGLTKAGYSLSLFARTHEKVHELEHSLNSEYVAVAHSLEESIELSDIIILALPYSEEGQVADEIKDLAEGKIVISIANPLNDTFSGLITGWETSSGEQLQLKLHNAKVVKAFNTIFASRINTPETHGTTIDHFIAGNDDEAVKNVSEIVKSLGHNPIQIGGIEESRTLEHMAFINISLSMKGINQWNTAYKLID